jgi:rhodanese-related sulfurtransferase
MKTQKKKICASCLKINFNKTMKSSKKHKPNWLNKIDYVEKFINNYKNFNINYPKNYNNKLRIFIGKQHKNKKILYWGAKPNNSILINDARTAYGSFSNSGVTIVNSDGFAFFKFSTPQNYKTIAKHSKNSTTYFKHIHFVLSNADCSSWNNNIYTKLVHNNFSIKHFIKNLNSRHYIVLNVLASEVYAKDHILNTYNLPYNSISKMSVNELNNWFKNIIDLHYPILKKLIAKRKLDYYELPIICYCAHNKCDASKIGAINLMKKGFVNVNLYEDGLKGYKQHKS